MRNLPGVPVVVTVLCVLGALSAACQDLPGQGDPQITVTLQKPEDEASVSVHAGSVEIDISSPSGIGGAEVTIGPGPKPAKILLRFHLEGLEHLEFRYGQTVVLVELPGSGDEPRESVSLQGAAETPIGPDSPYWMALTRSAPGSREDATIQVAAPQDFLAGPSRAFSLRWIDFYR